MNKTLVLLTLVAFSAFSLVAVWHHGYWGLFEPAFHSLASAQVLIDLTIMLTLFCVWMWRDARRNGRNPWPWLAAAATLGSIGVLWYLLLGPARASTTQKSTA